MSHILSDFKISAFASTSFVAYRQCSEQVLSKEKAVERIGVMN